MLVALLRVLGAFACSFLFTCLVMKTLDALRERWPRLRQRFCSHTFNAWALTRKTDGIYWLPDNDEYCTHEIRHCQKCAFMEVRSVVPLRIRNYIAMGDFGTPHQSLWCSSQHQQNELNRLLDKIMVKKEKKK